VQAHNNFLQLHNEFAGARDVLVCPAPHSLHGASEEMIRAGADAARRVGTRWHIHLAEEKYQVDDARPSHAVRSTAFFTVAGYSPRAVAERLAARQVNVWNGDNYAWELTGAFGLRDSGGAVRAGLVHYNDEADVDRLLAAVAELA